MSNNNAKDILLAVEATLTASPNLVPATLAQVKIGRDSDHSGGFPYCRIYLVGFSNPIADTVSYERGYPIAVEIWQECTNKSRRDAELDLANALHYVLNRLSGTWQLGISIEGSTIEGSPIQQVETNAGPMLLAALRLSVLTLIQNPS